MHVHVSCRFSFTSSTGKEGGGFASYPLAPTLLRLGEPCCGYWAVADVGTIVKSPSFHKEQAAEATKLVYLRQSAWEQVA